MSAGVTKISHPAPRKICGVGYIILSHAQDRDTYVGSCFRNNMVAIITEENEIIPKCIVSKNAWQYIEFPETSNQRGSAVIWMNIPYQNKVVIFDVLHKRDELNPVQRIGQFKFQRQFGTNIVNVQGDSTSGTINIIAQGSKDEEGQIYIKALNESEKAVFDLYVQGIINLNCESDLNINVGGELQVIVEDPANPGNQLNLNYTLGIGLTLADEFANNFVTKKDGTHLEVSSANKVYARATGATSQPGLLGTATNKVLNDIQNLLNSIVTTLQTASASGTNVLAAPVVAAVPTWTQDIIQIQSDMKNIIAQNFELS